MRPGDVAFVRPTSLPGYVVAHGSSARYCHVRLIVSEAGDTVEALASGAVRGRVQRGDVIASAPLTHEERFLIPAIADGLLGTPYGYRDVLALGLAQYGFRSPSLERRLERYDRLFCSQLVDVVWQAAGFHAFADGRLPQNVSPGDLADLAFVSNWPTAVYSPLT
jgi:hypothetical protein